MESYVVRIAIVVKGDKEVAEKVAVNLQRLVVEAVPPDSRFKGFEIQEATVEPNTNN